MDLSSKNENLLLSCNDKHYIKRNIEYLKAHFSSQENLDFLRLALTTKRNTMALKIVQQLELKITPFAYVNPYTYTSLYWLNRMDAITSTEFEGLKHKHRAIMNFETIFEETENDFIGLQIKKKREIYERIKTETDKDAKVSNLCFKEADKVTFMFFVDDVLDIAAFTEKFKDLKEFVFRSNLDTLETYNADLQKEAKIAKFREIKTRLYKHPLRSFSQFASLEAGARSQIESVMRFINKIKKFGYKFYVCSRAPLPDLLCFIYLCFNNIDLTKTMHLKSINQLPFPIIGRQVFFGKYGNVPWEFMQTAFENLSEMYNEKMSKEERIKNKTS